MPVTEDSQEKFDKTQKKYEKSAPGKARKVKWNNSDAGKNSRGKYLKSEMGQEALLRYYLSEKAETTRQQRQALLKLFRQVDKYIREHPEASPQEALEKLTN